MEALVGEVGKGYGCEAAVVFKIWRVGSADC